ncbi:MAG: Hsp20 family protein [Bauldia sp.]|nr:Hsp20 family protein [Bauldia sp.]
MPRTGPGLRKVASEGLCHRMSAFQHSFLLGFDEIERALGRAARRGGDGYPPYNVERFDRTEERGEVLRITLAVAGFRSEDLDVSVADNQLVIRGRQPDEPERAYLYRGIAARRFQRTFVLADGIEVLGADLSNGLLSIDLARPLKERPSRSVTINGPRTGP